MGDARGKALVGTDRVAGVSARATLTTPTLGVAAVIAARWWVGGLEHSPHSVTPGSQHRWVWLWTCHPGLGWASLAFLLQSSQTV